ncbi:hypothetical protein J3E68DRAFT_354471 [Trichoderma sp. SZMC 28012]
MLRFWLARMIEHAMLYCIVRCMLYFGVCSVAGTTSQFVRSSDAMAMPYSSRPVLKTENSAGCKLSATRARPDLCNTGSFTERETGISVRGYSWSCSMMPCSTRKHLL